MAEPEDKQNKSAPSPERGSAREFLRPAMRKKPSEEVKKYWADLEKDPSWPIYKEAEDYFAPQSKNNEIRNDPTDKKKIEEFLAKGLNVKKFGGPLLHRVIESNTPFRSTVPPPIQALVEAGADINFIIGGETPLHAAARTDQPTITYHLLTHKADYLIKNSEGKTALDVARTEGGSAKFHLKVFEDWEVKDYPDFQQLVIRQLENAEEIQRNAPISERPTSQAPASEKAGDQKQQTSSTATIIAPIVALLGVLGFSALGGEGISVTGVVLSLLAAGGAFVGAQYFTESGMFAKTPDASGPSVKKEPEPKTPAVEKNNPEKAPAVDKQSSLAPNMQDALTQYRDGHVPAVSAGEKLAISMPAQRAEKQGKQFGIS